MRTTCRVLVAVATVGVLMLPGCEVPPGGNHVRVDGQNGQAGRSADPSTAAPTRTFYTAQNNPTTRGGRGEPALADGTRPPAWLFVDEMEGHFVDENGMPQIGWVMPAGVSATPTFRLEVYTPLFESVTEVSFVLSRNTQDRSLRKTYGIVPDRGGFEVGKVYSLNKPGEGFTLKDVTDPRNPIPLDEIPPLEPSEYYLLARIVGPTEDVVSVAITSFVVWAEDEGKE